MRTPVPEILSWPLGNIGADGRLSWTRDDQSIREVMLNILLTRPGERLQRPTFGAGLLNFVHQPNNETTRHLIAGVVRKSLETWEPRVEIDEVQVQASPASVADVHINIRYRLRNSQRPAELGFTLNLSLPA
ncbi:GPW/gp25 family protein [Methylomonas sp. OY6]|uniref:GPW/gp25 family protein n=1 Tax=Methylomonas defluvii TaxID=3045149 RepID=A0ABU4UID6_9GAMM|nr:GPW/gp25 family protein [Methylomonas sp. OY6]MDX8129069.1 GPW/gp25 family protein [Methylomonas sp. OY6]